jgi:hypothetical protein
MNQGAMNLAFGTPYFNIATDRCRAIGARGGHRRALNLRLRQASKAPSAPQLDLLPEETAHEASLLLDQKFPHLIGTERHTAGRSRD